MSAPDNEARLTGCYVQWDPFFLPSRCVQSTEDWNCKRVYICGVDLMVVIGGVGCGDGAGNRTSAPLQAVFAENKHG